MKLLYFDETDKINRIPDEALKMAHTTREHLLRQQEKENAALLVCAGQLGPNHIALEMIDTYLTDLMNTIKKQKWYKFDIKSNFSKAYAELQDSIRISMKGSMSDSNYMMELSDLVSDNSKFDLFKLKNSLYLEFSKRKLKDADMLAELVMIYGLLQWINTRYKSIIDSMNKVFPALYDTWFSHASASKPLHYWELALESCLNKFGVKESIDLNESFLVSCGFHKIDSNLSFSQLSTQADNINHQNSELESTLLDAYKLLGINN